MSVKAKLRKAQKMVGIVHLAKELGVSHQAVNRWRDQNKMPCTEYNGETMYSRKIQELTNGEVTIEDLCGFVPFPQSDEQNG